MFGGFKSNSVVIQSELFLEISPESDEHREPPKSLFLSEGPYGKCLKLCEQIPDINAWSDTPAESCTLEQLINSSTVPKVWLFMCG